jgi:uncharacterized protein YhaN
VIAMPWRLSHADFAGAGMFALIAVVAALGAWAVSQLRAWRAAKQRRREAEIAALRTELYEARRSRDTHWRRAAERLEVVARDALSLGLPRHPKQDQLEEFEKEIDDQDDEGKRHGELEAKFEEIHSEVERAERELAVFEKRLERAREADEKAEHEWAAWKSAHALPDDLVIEQARELLDALQEAQAAARELGSAADEVAQLERETAAWEGRVRELLELEGEELVPDVTGDSLIDRVFELRRKHLESEQRYLVALRLDREIEERAGRIADAKAQVEQCESDLAALLREAGVSNEEEMERHREIYARRQALEQAIRERQDALDTSIGREGDAETIRAALVQSEPEQWKRQSAEIEGELRDLEQRLLDAAARHRDAERRRQDLEESTEVARLELEWNGLTSELVSAVRRWRVLAVAEGLIEQSFEEFRAARQPPL